MISAALPAILFLLAPDTVSEVEVRGVKVVEAEIAGHPRSRSGGIYPPEARDTSIAGLAEVRCTIDLEGRAHDCAVIRETPFGMGFGAQAVRVFEEGGRFHPRTVNGKPVAGGRTTTPLRFTPGRSGRSQYLLTEPVWIRTPDAAAMAGAVGTEGAAALRCGFRPDGGLQNCEVAGETGEAFGRAAMGLTDRFELKVGPDLLAKAASTDVVVSFHFLNPTETGAEAERVREPRWIVRPGPDAMRAAFPTPAIEAGARSGRAVVDCLVTAEGGLADCAMVDENPGNLGFGASALTLAAGLRMNLWTDRGRPAAGAWVRLPMDFNLTPEPAPAAE